MEEDTKKNKKRRKEDKARGKWFNINKKKWREIFRHDSVTVCEDAHTEEHFMCMNMERLQLCSFSAFPQHFFFPYIYCRARLGYSVFLKIQKMFKKVKKFRKKSFKILKFFKISKKKSKNLFKIQKILKN